MSYWVVGGRYKNTNFETLKENSDLEKYGPFNDYESAKREWDNLSWRAVDDCFVRYTVVLKKKNY